jgi:hypothetical protein
MGFTNPMLQHNENEWTTLRPEPYEYHARQKTIALWVIVAILAAVLGALVFYGYRTVKTQNIRITEMFGRQGTAGGTLDQRTEATESKLHDLTGVWQGVGQRVTTLEGKVAADAKSTRRYAETLTQQLHQQIIAEMDSRTSALDTRLRQIESEEAAQRAQLAQVEANLKQEITAAQEANGRDLSGVRQQEESNAREVGSLSHRLDRQRIDFELGKGQTKELVPGISLQIRGVNTAHERYHGALSLVKDHRTVWLRDQSAHQPVRFFPIAGGEPYDLVVTDVSKKSVSGYLLAPEKPDAAAAAVAEPPVGGEGSARE